MDSTTVRKDEILQFSITRFKLKGMMPSELGWREIDEQNDF